MDSSGNNDNGGGSTFSERPFTWVLVPLCVIVCAALVITCIRYRLRNKQRQSYGTNALERDLEALGPNRVRRPANPRWQWAGMDVPQRAGMRRVGLGVGVGSREEGLNELGEAPPAYTAPAKSSGNMEEVELGDVQRTMSTEQTPQTLPTSRTANPGELARPPSYDSHSPSVTLHPQPESNQAASPTLPPSAILSHG